LRLIDQKGKGGRPPLKPGKQQRKLAETCVATGMSHMETAAVLGISKPTLEFHFRDELKNGRARRLADMLVLLDRAAQHGCVPAMKYLATLFAGGVQGKKERLEREAANPASDTWGDDLLPMAKLQ
jgi:DNA-binding CsgD family transcriptional regulator